MRIRLSFILVSALFFAVSCRDRSYKSDSESNLITTNDYDWSWKQKQNSSTPTPIRDASLDSVEDLKVLEIKTAQNPLPPLAPQDCPAVTFPGPNHAPDVDCTEAIRQRIKDVSGFEGILAQNFRFNTYSGFPWSSACRPTLVRLQMRERLLSRYAYGVNFYLAPIPLNGCDKSKATDGCMLANVKGFRADEVGKVASRNGEFLVANFIFLAKCEKSNAELKAYYADYNDHWWEVFKGNHIIE